MKLKIILLNYKLSSLKINKYISYIHIMTGLLYLHLYPKQVGLATRISSYHPFLFLTVSSSTPHDLIFFLIVFIYFFFWLSLSWYPSTHISSLYSWPFNHYFFFWHIQNILIYSLSFFQLCWLLLNISFYICILNSISPIHTAHPP